MFRDSRDLSVRADVDDYTGVIQLFRCAVDRAETNLVNFFRRVD